MEHGCHLLVVTGNSNFDHTVIIQRLLGLMVGNWCFGMSYESHQRTRGSTSVASDCSVVIPLAGCGFRLFQSRSVNGLLLSV